MLSVVAFARPAKVNLVPDAPGKTPNYWCTWGAQNDAVDKNSAASAMSHSTLASNLTEENVFGAKGWAWAFAKVRGDLYLLFDLGWDVPRGLEFDSARWKLGTQEVATDKFPSCAGSPVERLRKLNEMTKRAGWRGAALWIPAHARGDGRDGKLLPEAELERFFTERLRWSRDAGIEYWKIDYGARNNETFRRMVTRLSHEIAPGLKVEHSRGSCPLNDVRCPWEENLNVSNSGSFRAWDNGSVLKSSAAIARFSDIFRTYDVTLYLSIPTTLDRSANVLAELAGQKDADGILNCEDEPYVAAALGLMMGVLRHPRWLGPNELGQEYDPHELRRRIDEVTRAVRWHRIAPAFAMGASPMALDPKRLDDTWLFRKGDTWAEWVVGTTVKQGAPARVGRGMALPEVKGAELPFAIAARNPNGAVSVATLPRIEAGRGFCFPLADVAFEVTDAAMPVGVFGRYRSLTLRLSRAAAAFVVMAQDLAGDSARDITPEVKRHGNEITIPGRVIERIGLSAATPGDVSDPGLVLKLSER